MTYVWRASETEARWISGEKDSYAPAIETALQGLASSRSISASLKTGLSIGKFRITKFGSQIVDAVSMPIPYHSDEIDGWWGQECSQIFVLHVWQKSNEDKIEWLRGHVLPKQILMISHIHPGASIFIALDADNSVANCLNRHGFIACEPSDRLYRRWCEDVEYVNGSSLEWFIWRA